MPQVYADDEVTIELLPALGSFENNAYIVRPAAGGAAVLVDFPEGFEAVAQALGDEAASAVLLTHGHMDHTRGYEALRELTSAPIHAGAAETDLDESWAVRRLADGDTVAVGGATLRAIHTPGHTPGSTCYLVGEALLSGDTLFPGGPGHSSSAETLRQEIQSITSKLHTLPVETLVLPGHGDGTTIGESRREYAVFAEKEHPADLHGDVLWLES